MLIYYFLFLGQNSKSEFDSIIASVLRSDWSVDLPTSTPHYYVTWGATHVIEGTSQFGKPVGKLSTTDLAEIIQKATITYSKCIHVHLQFTNVFLGREHFEMSIVIFREVLEHVANIDRVLSSPGGSLLLAGRSGAGRRTAVKLVAHMHSMDIVTPHISRNYSVKHFKNDLKQVSIN